MPITHLVPPERRIEKGAKGVMQNPLLRLLAINWLIGLIATCVVFAGLLVTNVAGLTDLIFTSENPIIPLALLFFGLMVTFCSVAMGAAIIRLHKDDP